MRKPQPCSVIPVQDLATSYVAAIKENPRNASQRSYSLFGTGEHNRLWRPGRTITMRFLEPVSSDYLGTFLRAAGAWLPHANLVFQVITRGNADIRITTDTEDNKSLIGTDALTYDQSFATLHIERPLDDEFFKSTVTHEMGHALGFMHEHMHPNANIPWNRQKVYDYYFDEYEWEKDRVDENVFNPFSGSIGNTEYDKQSIMHYAVDKDLTDGVWEVRKNLQLSELDKKMAAIAYPR